MSVLLHVLLLLPVLVSSFAPACAIILVVAAAALEVDRFGSDVECHHNGQLLSLRQM